MEDISVRILLLVAGVIIIAAIYLWDKRKTLTVHKARRSRHKKTDKRRQHDSAVFDKEAAEQSVDDFDVLMSEPVGGDEFPAEFSMSIQSDQDSVMGLDKNDLSFPARHAFQEFEAGADLPTKILQLSLLSKGNPISGQMIVDLAAELNLQFGEFNIYHFIDQPTGKPIFSMANAVEPGSFNIAQMESFSTPGLTLFARLPAPIESSRVLEDMLKTGQRIAFIVGAELQDASHCALTAQSTDHLREQIKQYQHQLDRAMQSYS